MRIESSLKRSRSSFSWAAEAPGGAEGGAGGGCTAAAGAEEAGAACCVAAGEVEDAAGEGEALLTGPPGVMRPVIDIPGGKDPDCDGGAARPGKAGCAIAGAGLDGATAVELSPAEAPPPGAEDGSAEEAGSVAGSGGG
jgi:hypothetical protein